MIQKVSGITDEKTLEVVFQNLYTNFVEALDGIDNGVKQYDTTALPRYSI